MVLPSTMRGFRLNGWQRSAIVLSVLWAIGAWLFIVKSFERDAEAISVRMYDDCVVHRSGPGEDCLNTMNQVRDFQMAIARKQAAARALLPIPIGWMVIWLANVMVRSIRRGFQSAL